MSEGRDGASGWLELALAVLMALAAVGTAWAGFQSAKWGGVQANAYAQSGASRTESNRAATEAGQQRIVDVVTFGTWLTALDDVLLSDPSADPDDLYQPGDESVHGFRFLRFRDAFRPAMEAWLAQEPFHNEAAPITPFEMPEYQLDAQERAHELSERADQLSARARSANAHSGNYVLTAVIFALVLFFNGVASRTEAPRARHTLFSFGVITMVVALGVLLTLPVTF